MALILASYKQMNCVDHPAGSRLLVVEEEGGLVPPRYVGRACLIREWSPNGEFPFVKWEDTLDVQWLVVKPRVLDVLRLGWDKTSFGIPSDKGPICRMFIRD